MNSYRKLLIYILFALCFINTAALQSKGEGYTNFVIKGSANINGNLYLSDFKQLPGIENESPGFTSAFGLGASFGIGAEYIFDDKLFGSDFRYGFQVLYTNLSANYSVEEKIGNNIVGNSLGQPYVVDHRLEPSISAILTEHIIVVNPFSGTPVSFLGGFRAGFPISNKFSQEEDLIKPAGAEFLEGGTIRYKSSGEIPEASSFYFALVFGARYEGYKIGDISFNPELTYAYGLTNMVSSLDWKAGGVRLGISIQYNVPKAVAAPPLPAPLPELPMPEQPPKPKPALLELTIGIKYNSIKYNNIDNNDNIDTDIADGGNISYDVKIEEYYEDFKFVPVLYYEKGETVPAVVPAEISNILGMSARIDILYGAIQYLKQNENVNVGLIPYIPAGEDENIISGRVKFITGRFDSAGLGNRLSIRKTKIVSDEFSYDELKDESRKIEFEFSSGDKAIEYKSENQKKYVSENISLRLYADIVAEAKPYVYEGSVEVQGRPAVTFDNEDYILNLPPDQLLELSGNEENTIVFTAMVKDAESKEIDRKVSVNLIARERIAASYKNLNTNNSKNTNNSNYEQFVLGYFRFDRSTFFYVDKNVVGAVKQALRDGKKVQLLALTDNLGTEEHNSTLASKRVKSALDELMISDKDIEVIIPNSPLFPNTGAYGRSLNRSVIVRILQK